MSSLLSNSPRGGAPASTADKLKSFGSRLNRGFGIAKRWTLEKVGARESEQEAPEVQALIAAFGQDKADLDELRAKVQQMVATERSLLDSDKSFAQQLVELQVAIPETSPIAGTETDGGEADSGSQSAMSTIEAVSSAFASAPTGSTASSATATDDAFTTASATTPTPAVSTTRHPPFTPTTFSTYLTHLHAAHTRYTAALSTALLDPIDLLLTQDVSVCQTMIKQLPLLRLDHAAKHDRAEKLSVAGGDNHEEAVRDERESREVYEAQLEVVEKLARELHVKLDRLLRELCERYVTEAEHWYAAQQAIIEEAVRDSEGRMQPVAGVLDVEPTGVKDAMEAAVSEVVDQLDKLGGQMIDGPTGEPK